MDEMERVEVAELLVTPWSGSVGREDPVLEERESRNRPEFEGVDHYR